MHRQQRHFPARVPGISQMTQNVRAPGRMKRTTLFNLQLKWEPTHWILFTCILFKDKWRHIPKDKVSRSIHTLLVLKVFMWLEENTKDLYPPYPRGRNEQPGRANSCHGASEKKPPKKVLLVLKIGITRRMNNKMYCFLKSGSVCSTNGNVFFLWS